MVHRRPQRIACGTCSSKVYRAFYPSSVPAPQDPTCTHAALSFAFTVPAGPSLSDIMSACCRYASSSSLYGSLRSSPALALTLETGRGGRPPLLGKHTKYLVVGAANEKVYLCRACFSVYNNIILSQGNFNPYPTAQPPKLPTDRLQSQTHQQHGSTQSRRP